MKCSRVTDDVRSGFPNISQPRDISWDDDGICRRTGCAHPLNLSRYLRWHYVTPRGVDQILYETLTGCFEFVKGGPESIGHTPVVHLKETI